MQNVIDLATTRIASTNLVVKSDDEKLKKHKVRQYDHLTYEDKISIVFDSSNLQQYSILKILLSRRLLHWMKNRNMILNYQPFKPQIIPFEFDEYKFEMRSLTTGIKNMIQNDLLFNKLFVYVNGKINLHPTVSWLQRYKLKTFITENYFKTIYKNSEIKIFHGDL